MNMTDEIEHHQHDEQDPKRVAPSNNRGTRENSDKKYLRVRGILFRCTIRSGHATLAIVVTSISDDNDIHNTENYDDSLKNYGKQAQEVHKLEDERVVLVVIQFGGSEWGSGQEPQHHVQQCPLTEGIDSEGRGDNGTEINADGDKNNNKQNKGKMTLMRSNIRRISKLGNELEFRGFFNSTTSDVTVNTTNACISDGNRRSNSDESSENKNIEKPQSLEIHKHSNGQSTWGRFIVNYYLPDSQESLTRSSPAQQTTNSVRLLHIQKWDAQRCQNLRTKYFAPPPRKQPTKRVIERSGDGEGQEKTLKQNTAVQQQKKGQNHCAGSEHHARQDKQILHGGGVGKRKQGEIVADFLLWMLSTIYIDDDLDGFSKKGYASSTKYQRSNACEYSHISICDSANNDNAEKSNLAVAATDDKAAFLSEETSSETDGKIAPNQPSSDCIPKDAKQIDHSNKVTLDEPKSISHDLHKNIDEDGLEQKQTQHHLWMERLVPLHPSLLQPCASSTTQRNAMIAKAIENGPKELDKFTDTDVTKEKTGNAHDANDSAYSAQPCGGGIIDAAGGAGHVSLSLALRGVRSTVVDPRPNVGKLPGRDRKVLKKAMSQSLLPHSKSESTALESKNNDLTEKSPVPATMTPKAVPFSTYRAWFGSRPNGVDTLYREGCADASDKVECNNVMFLQNNSIGQFMNNDPIPICSMCSEDKLLPSCNAIVALHPDEATGAIVETAVKHKIPFVVVPCCVFSRLFPDRIKPRSGVGGDGYADSGISLVSTYYDLIDWLLAKHPSICVTRLPFDGANLAVWSSFVE